MHGILCGEQWGKQNMIFYSWIVKIVYILSHLISAYRTCQADDIHCGLPSSSNSKNDYSTDPCVPKEKQCDGYLDCRSGRDEEGCQGAKCRLDQFRCANGQKCIDNVRKCDHKADCDDGSDEIGCSKYPTILLHLILYWIHFNWWDFWHIKLKILHNWMRVHAYARYNFI